MHKHDDPLRAVADMLLTLHASMDARYPDPQAPWQPWTYTLLGQQQGLTMALDLIWQLRPDLIDDANPVLADSPFNEPAWRAMATQLLASSRLFRIE